MQGARFVVVVAVVVGVAFVVGLLPAPAHPLLVPLDEGWRVRCSSLEDTTPAHDAVDDARWRTLSLPGSIAPCDEVLWLRRPLPRSAGADNVAAFDAVLGPFEASVDGVAVHDHPRGEGLRTTTIGGLPWHLVPVPAGARELVLRIRVSGQNDVVRGTPLFGPRADILARTVERDLPRLAVGV